MGSRLLVRALVIALLCGVTDCHADVPSASPERARVSTEDVHRFVQVFRAIPPGDSACPGLEAYYRNTTPGFDSFRRMMGSSKELCREILRRRPAYAALEGKLPAFDSVGPAIRQVHRQFAALYPPTVYPDVYLVVGRFMSGGTSTDGKLLIGAEMIRDPARVRCTVAHELVHAQQHYPWRDRVSGGPAFLRATLLASAVKEGSADFVAQLATGCAPALERSAWAQSREAALWAEFQRDMHGKDYSRWLYGPAIGDRPTDLGYTVGYWITRSYFEHARDKRAALHDIMNIRDFDAFLARSGYAGPAMPKPSPPGLRTRTASG